MRKTIKILLDVEFDPQDAISICGSSNTRDVAEYIAQTINSGHIGNIDVFLTRNIGGKYIPVGEPF